MYIHYENLEYLLRTYPIIALLIGLVIWALGWKIYKVFITVAGAFVGASILYQFAWNQEQLIQILAAVVGAILGAVLALFAMYVMLFLFGVYVGAGVASVYLGATSAILNLVAGVAVGILFVLIYKFAVIFITSFTGSFLIFYSLPRLLPIQINYWVVQILIVAATLAGIFYQYKVLGQPDDRVSGRSRNE